MSHELRTAMNGIIGLSGILADMELGTKAQELSEAVHQSSRNLLVLLIDILDFSKIEAGELHLENIAFDPRQMVDQVVRLQHSVAASKPVSLACDIADDVPARLTGDPTRLQQILNNLVGNALLRVPLQLRLDRLRRLLTARGTGTSIGGAFAS